MNKTSMETADLGVFLFLVPKCGTGDAKIANADGGSQRTGDHCSSGSLRRSRRRLYSAKRMKESEWIRATSDGKTATSINSGELDSCRSDQMRFSGRERVAGFNGPEMAAVAIGDCGVVRATAVGNSCVRCTESGAVFSVFHSC
jgi:hypothetical protein